MLIAAEQAAGFVENVAFDSFASDPKLQLALGMLLQIIGENPKGLSPETAASYRKFPGPRSLECGTG